MANFTNTTGNTVAGTKLNKTFFDRQLLEGARTRQAGGQAVLGRQ